MTEGRSFLVPRRLTADVAALPPVVLSEPYEKVAQVAIEWQQMRVHEDFWEFGGRRRNYGYSMARLFALGGERLAMAYTAAVEIARWHLQHATDVQKSWHFMCIHSLLELQSYYVTALGHQLANIVIRSLSLREDLREELGEYAVDDFLKPSKWADLEHVKTRIRNASRAAHSARVSAFTDPLLKFARSKAWTGLSERRNDDFHRWRSQDYDPVSSPWQQQGDAWRLEGGALPPAPNLVAVAEFFSAYREDVLTAMLSIADVMETLLPAWTRASEELGGPPFVIDDGDEPATDS